MSRTLAHLRRLIAVLAIGVLGTLSTGATAQADTQQLRWQAILSFQDGDAINVYGTYNSGCVAPWKNGPMTSLFFVGNEYADTIELFDDRECTSKIFQAGSGEWNVGNKLVMAYQVY
ncbi:hypothetical protein BLA60_29860 [Actinophytocola xinjiangensis]|uniref:Beta/gamma crystallin n=1 Tax=Actinophytocola xinjiangensis TaxID=485602 RepID=A0A7Z0WI97_9PSEU|nr:hypothetical protein [Actinophytocola xinjiangensis]OLF06767.1 hypothetical protein BLA60_29860 [Actinophytocola xinjiangensis]